MNESYLRIICPYLPKYLSLSHCKYCAIAKANHKNLNKIRTNKKTLIKHINKRNINKNNSHKKVTFSERTTDINLSLNNSNVFDQHSRNKPGEYIVSDIKHMPKSIGDKQFLCIFTDVASRLSTPIYMKHKHEAEQAYIDYCKDIRNKTGKYPKFVHTDGGGEFIANIVKNFNKKKGITHTYTSSNNSLQNPIAERINRTTGEGTLSLLITANLPSSFWEFATNMFLFIKNRTPHKHLNLSNPMIEWNIYNKHVSNIDIYDLRIFGCEAYVLDEHARKNQPKAFRCIYLGPSNTHKGSIFYNLYTQKIITSSQFTLNEQCFPGNEYFPKIYEKWLGKPPTILPNNDLNKPTSDNYHCPTDRVSIPNYDYDMNESITDTRHDIPYHSYIHSHDSTIIPIASDEETLIIDSDIPVESFSRKTSREGPADIPDLPISNDNNLSNLESCLDSPSPSESTNTDLQEKTPVDVIDGQPVWEVKEITDKRKSRHALKRDGGWKPKHGYDYEVKWDTGETTWEHESHLKNAPEAIDRYENSLSQNQDNSQTDPSGSPDSPPNPEANNLTNYCNFVHLAFFVALTKLVPSLNSSTLEELQGS